MDELSRKILDAIRESGQSVYAIAQGAGVERVTLHRWVTQDWSADKQREIGLRTAAKLCAYLALELRPIPKSRRRKGRSTESTKADGTR